MISASFVVLGIVIGWKLRGKKENILKFLKFGAVMKRKSDK